MDGVGDDLSVIWKIHRVANWTGYSVATKTATAQVQKPENTEETSDGPLLDGVVQEVKKLLAKGKERGYITIDELNAILTQDQVSSEQIEDTMTMLSEMGINVIDGEESDDSADKAASEGAAAARDGRWGPRPRRAASSTCAGVTASGSSPARLSASERAPSVSSSRNRASR